MFSDVVLKKIEPQRVISIRDVVPVYCKAWAQWDELSEYLIKHKIMASGPPLTIFHDPENRDRNTDVETCMPISASPPTEGRIKIHELPGAALMACVRFQGELPQICAIGDGSNDDPVEQMCGILMDWIEDNGYRVIGPSRDVYVRTGDAGGEVATIPSEYVTDNPAEYITEVQFPVEKV